MIRWLSLVLPGALALVFLASTAAAEPAAIPDSGDDRARTAFREFADTWMEKIRTSADEQRRNPTIRPGADRPMVTYRSYGEEYTVELRPTGHATAPYVGILRYKEQVWSCRDTAASDCTVSSTVPVTEIFRYQNGRWVY